ncbi:unnamed protein product [Lactuca saligna]|uniref:Uncharacterized protein n=1 Tax=Lactuca saligna TaxID=75948 RepID=A0AA35VWJ5_LACSI|nr:unnamed protein product [Lactuca saligna]
MNYAWNNCSTFETRHFIKTNRPVDGVSGLGQQGISVISEISSQGIAPNSFIHCLAGDGGRLLVLRKPIMPDIVFTHLVKSKVLRKVCCNSSIPICSASFLSDITVVGVISGSDCYATAPLVSTALPHTPRFPTSSAVKNHHIELSQLRDRDSLRHGRILNKYYDPRGVVTFAILGTYDLPVVWWHYIINLESISVNGQTLVFSLNDNKGNDKYTLCSMTLQAPQHVLITGALTISTLKMGFRLARYICHFQNFFTRDCTKFIYTLSCRVLRKVCCYSSIPICSASFLSDITVVGVVSSSDCYATEPLLSTSLPHTPPFSTSSAVKNYYDTGEEIREIRIYRFPATLSLERAFPLNHHIELSQLRDRDSLRHNKILNKYYDPRGVVAFAILGTYDLPVVWWHYIINLESISVNGQTLVFSLNDIKGNDKFTLCSMTLQAPQHVLITGALTISTLKMGFGSARYICHFRNFFTRDCNKFIYTLSCR